MKKFILQVVLFSAPILLIMAGINYTVDPAFLFQKGGVEMQMADLMAQGHTVVGITNRDERLLQKFYTQSSLTATPDLLVLGSSRAMLINKNIANGESFFNSSVSSAALEDVMAIYQLWEEKGAKIKRVIIEVPPDWFNESYQISAWKILMPQYEKMMAKIGVSETSKSLHFISPKYTQLFDPSYFQTAGKDFLSRDQKPSVETGDSSDVRFLKFPDGSIRYPKDYYAVRTPDPAEVQEWLTARGLSYSRLSPKKQEKFEAFLNYLTTNGTRVELLMNVYHPDFYTLLEKRSPALKEIPPYLEKLAQSNELITSKGAFDPAVYDLKPEDFFDVPHPREHVYPLVLAD